MFANQEAKKLVKAHANRKPKVPHHEITRPEICLSMLVGGAAVYITKSTVGLYFGLAVGGLVTVACLAGSYLYTRKTALDGIPKYQDGGNDSRKKLPSIADKHMSGDDPRKLNRDTQYHLGFCYKPGFKDEFAYLGLSTPLKHSSIVLAPVDLIYSLSNMSDELIDDFLTRMKNILVIGRQSPALRKNSSGFFSLPMSEAKRTLIDNEGNYELFPGAAFEPMMSDAIFSGEEIKLIVDAVDRDICEGKGQICLMFNSNCYSGSVFFLAKAVEILKFRHDAMISEITMEATTLLVDIRHNPERYNALLSLSESTHKQMQDLCFLMLNVMQHNLGQGVINNPAVINQINKALKISHKFDPQLSEQLLRDLAENVDHTNKENMKDSGTLYHRTKK